MSLVDLATWCYVVGLGALFGGSLFEFRVLVHVWASSPAVVRGWNTDPATKLDPPRRFFVLVTPPLLLLTPIDAWLAWSGTQPGRAWMLTSTALTCAVIVVTLAYFAPVMTRLTMQQGAGLDDAQVARKARTWVRLQYLRVGAVLLAWLAALQAFRLG